MSLKGSHRSPNLFVVKGVDVPRRITGVEELTNEQHELVESYKKQSYSEGVLVGVLHGKAAWDLRPLLLSQGRIFTLRFSDPSLSGYPELNANFSSLLHALQIERNITASITVGQAGEQHWVRRLWFDETLADVMESQHSQLQPEAFIRALVLEVGRLHRMGLAHGHLSPSNISLVQNFPCVFDFGFLTATPAYSAPDCAPEIQAGGFASRASDIYGIGLIIRDMLGHSPHALWHDITERMTLSEPNLRPSLEEVRYLIETPAAHARVERGVPGGHLLTGRGVEQQQFHPYTAENAAPVPAQNQEIRKVSGFLLGILGTLAILGCWQLWKISFKSPAERQVEYQQYWESGQPSFMKIVAEAAIEDQDQFAQAIIIKAVENGENKVLADLFKVAFDPRWEEQLTDVDRGMVIGLASEKMLHYPVALPPLDQLSPGVILALASSLSLESPGRQLEKVPLSAMTSLPGDVGNAFRTLAAEGIQHMEQLQPKALSHLLAGDISGISILAYFKDCGEMPACLARLSAILPSVSRTTGLDSVLYAKLPAAAPPLAPLLGWFETEDFAGWSSVKALDKMQLMAGRIPSSVKSFEAAVDLLRFPLKGVREEAVKIVVENPGIGPAMQSFISTIAALPSDQSVSRAQNIALLHAMRNRGEIAFTFFEQWFSTRPNPQAVLRLLLSRPDVGGMDPFSLEACRYLSREAWTINDEDLRKLVKHDEPLARALAYNKLRVDIPQEFEILQQMSQEEPNQRNRDLIKKRLETAQLMNRN